MPETFELYGLDWPKRTPQIEIERYMIQQGGMAPHPKTKEPCGMGLFYHYRMLQTLLWPEDDHHEWSDLILKTIIEERITAVQGPKDASKTRTVSKWALTDYFCFPEESLFLISSNYIQGLQLRVWGDLKTLYTRAKEVWSNAPGVPLESKYGIFTDELDDNAGLRDMRKGIICVAMRESNGQWVGMQKYCFPAGQMVDMGDGSKKPIEYVEVGDLVRNATGSGVVSAVSHRTSEDIVRVNFSDGRSVDCTPNHRFFTNSGWCSAIDLTRHHYVFSPNDSMRVMREGYTKRKIPTEVLRHGLQGEVLGAPMQAVREAFQERGYEGIVLQQILRSEVCLEKEGVQGEGSIARFQSNRKVHKQFPYEQSEREAKAVIADERSQFENEYDCCELGNSAQEQREGLWKHREWTFSEQGGSCIHEDIPGDAVQSVREVWETSFGRIPALSQARFQCSRIETLHRDRRGNAYKAKSDRERCEEGLQPKGSWVDSVEVIKRGGIGESGSDETGCVVYNLQVEGHPSYSVNGFLVHNCGIKQNRRRLIADEMQFYSPSYLSTLANLDKGDFKGVFIGNPIGEMDPLDRVSEPEDGWGSEGEISKTSTWRNKFDGVTVQLFGPDSPAINHPGQFTYLTNQVDIDRISRRFGSDSFEFFQQAHGVRKPGAMARRVYTKDMAEQFGSQEPPMWGNGDITKIYGLDAAYGGDRCVGIMAEFGKDINGVQIIAFSEPMTIPIRVYAKSVPVEDRVLPEDQIADAVKEYCESNNIPPENVFFDATGRGSLGTSFSRRWSSAVNPIEFGGSPTDRPICSDWYINDPKDGHRRLKTAKEQYVKFVTELWFTMRYAGEARQLRSLPNSVLSELCRRAWMPAKGDRKELETKEEYKKTYGQSPDNADAAVTALEGARRRGFAISNLETPNAAKRDENWKFILQDRARRFRKSYTLSYATTS